MLKTNHKLKSGKNKEKKGFERKRTTGNQKRGNIDEENFAI